MYVVPICWFSRENSTAVFEIEGQKEQVQSQVHENMIQGSVAGLQPCAQGTWAACVNTLPQNTQGLNQHI